MEAEESVEVGVAVRNVYALVLGSEGEEDGEAIIANAIAKRKADAAKAKQAAREAAKLSKTKAAMKKAESPKTGANKETSPKEESTKEISPVNGAMRGGRGGRGGARGGLARGRGGGARGGRQPPPPPPHQDSNDFAEFQADEAPQAPTEGGGGNFGGGFEGAVSGGWGGGQRPNFRGRQFDRRSGTDRDQGQKRGGAGKGNWGTAEDELKGETEPLPPASDEEKDAAAKEPKDGEDEAAAKEAAKAKEEPRQLTLDEWRASRGPIAKPNFNIRKAGEGEAKDKKQLKPLERPPEDPLLKANDEDDYYIIHKPSKKKELNVELKFVGGPPTRGGRGGFAGVGGRGGRGGKIVPTNPEPKAAFAKAYENASHFQVDDASFPSLS